MRSMKTQIRNLKHLIYTSSYAVVGCFLMCSASSLHADDDKSHRPTSSVTLASVNGEKISTAMLEFLGGKREQGLLSADPVQRDQLLNDLVTTELLYQKAIESETQNKPVHRIELELAHKTLLTQLYVMDYLANLSISEKDLREMYEAIQAPVMVRMATWSFDNREAADRFLAHVLEGGIPENDGAEQPWQALEYLPFANDSNAQALDSEEWLKVPVAFGAKWQVWKCLERSEMTKPRFENAREGIRQELGQEKLQAHIAALKERATIVMNPK